MSGEVTTSATFDPILQRLFAIMREKADAGDLDAVKFLETKIGPTIGETDDAAER